MVQSFLDIQLDGVIIMRTPEVDCIPQIVVHTLLAIDNHMLMVE